MIPTMLFLQLSDKHRFIIRNSFFGLVVKILRSYKLSKRRIVYSQFGESEILVQYFQDGKGFYLDIGSGDPVRGSNTYFLYKQGWTGILIDPVSRNIRASKILRRKDRIIQGLVGTANKSYLFFEMYPYEYSTTDHEVFNRLIDGRKAKLVRKMHLNTISISQLKLNITLDQPSLLNIDCEGLDLEVLSTIDLGALKFRVICVEDFDYNPVSKSSAINQYLNENGYEIVDRAGPSSIYVKSSWLEENLN